jgi:hypothetical protein
MNRGIAKENLNDMTGACSDWKSATGLGATIANQFVDSQCN